MTEKTYRVIRLQFVGAGRRVQRVEDDERLPVDPCSPFVALGGNRPSWDRSEFVRNILGGDGGLHIGGDLVYGDAEAVGDHVHRLSEERDAEAQNRWLGEEFGFLLAEAQPVDVVQRCVGEDVHDLVDLYLVDLADHPGQRERQNVSRISRMDASRMERSPAFRARGADLVAAFAEIICRVEESSRGDDVLARAQEPADGVGVHDDRRVEHAVRVEGHDRLDVVGGAQSDRRNAGDLSRVLANLLR